MSLTTPVKISIPFCNSGSKASIPTEATTSSDNSNYASYEAGFPAVTMIPLEAGGIPPRGVDVNGILYELSTNIQNWNAGVQMRFDADFCEAIGGYPAGAVLQSDDGKTCYVSTVENNTGNFNEDTSLIGTDWILYSGGSSIRFGVASGSDIIAVTYADPVTELEDGMLLSFQAEAANETTTPSFNPNDLGATTIVKGANAALAAGDIGGEGYLAILQYSENFGKWVLQNPATGVDIVAPEVMTGATSEADGASGLVPAPAAGQQAYLLNGAGSWVSAPTVAMPVGAVYFQLAGQSAPADLFGGTWENISSTYAGYFFRAEGGNAASFGSAQSGGAPNIYGEVSWSTGAQDSWGPNYSGVFSAARSGTSMTSSISGAGDLFLYFNAYSYNSAYSLGEFRPDNSTIRIWLRTE